MTDSDPAQPDVVVEGHVGHVKRAGDRGLPGEMPRPIKVTIIGAGSMFSSSTCTACRATWEKARQLESDEVAVCDLDSVADAGLHRRYGIDAVPLVLIADAEGRVRGSFLGEPPAADLWKAVADAREGPADEG